MATEDVTLGELARRLDAFEQRVDRQFAANRQQIESLTFVQRDVYEVRHQALIDRVVMDEERIDALEEAKKWTIRTFVMAFIFPVLAAVLVALTISR